MEHMIVKIKSDNGYDILINLDNINYVLVAVNGGYRVWFTNGHELTLTWKEYDRLDKAIQTISE